MTRARQILVGGVASRAMLSHTIAMALGTVALGAAGSFQSSHVVENRGQAMPKGAQRAIQHSRTDRRQMKREAVKELMDMTRQTVVVAHLHPRWLRKAVEDMMDAGAKIDMAAVELLKSQGPEAARQIVEAYVGE